MKASIIVIGDEILLGQVTDTNSGEIARVLGPMGWQIVETRVVGDDAESIRSAIDAAMAQSQLVITTGGLGPTKDDITKGVMMEVFGGELREDAEVAANVERIFARRGLRLNELTRSQALVPDSCRVIQNAYGTAPIMVYERQGHTLIAMPGVPHEMAGMLHHGVADEIRRLYMPTDTLRHHTLIVSGISESALAERLEGYERALPAGLHLAYLPYPGYIRLRLDGTNVDAGVYEQKVAELKAALGSLLLHDGDGTPAQILLERLRSQGLTVSTSESCTGGNIAHSITEIAGSSDCYMGSVVSYSNDVKHRVLGVSEADLATHGAVSQPVVEQMARGAARVVGTDCAISTSGIAGPGGGSEAKPVGTVWMAVSVRGQVHSQLLHLAGNRARVIERATTEAILMLIRQIG